MKDYKEQMAALIDELCTKITTNKLSQYDRVAKSFTRFFNQDELGQILDKKADLELIQRLQDTKATKVELNYLSSLIDALNGRIKHLAILQAEIAKVGIPNKASSSFKAKEEINTKL
jgi:hypothetical protein